MRCRWWIRSLLPTLRAIDPRLHQLASTLGASPLRQVASIDLPLAARVSGWRSVFAFATSLGEFGATTFLLVRIVRPLPVAIFHLIGRPGMDNQGMALAASVMLAVLTAVVMVGGRVGWSEGDRAW